MASFSNTRNLRETQTNRMSGAQSNGSQTSGGSGATNIPSSRGTNSDDVLTGSDRNDKLNARGGDDLLIESAGNDKMNGGNGYDTAVFSGSRSDYVVEQVGRWIEVSRNGETDRLTNIEELRFEGSAETFAVANGDVFDQPSGAGSPGSGQSPNAGQSIRGTNADDVLGGGAGDDSINGRKGDDLFVDSGGSDDVNGGRGHDTAFFTGEITDYTIEFSGNSIYISNGTDTDRLTSIEELLFGVSPDDAGATSYLITPNGLVEQSPAGPEPNPAPTPPPPPPAPQPPAGQDTPASLDAFETEVLQLVNEFRAANGLGPLRSDSRLNTAADDWSEAMAEGDFFNHSTPAQVEEQGYDWRNWGENIAAGQPTPESVVNAWINSPGHRANILNDSFQEIGIGYYYLEDDTGSLNYHHYWTQTFGTEFGDAIV